ncbi:hypothetical protein SEA_FLATHEAD_106 [Mycobacterium phage Flathead]|nr:hypothetical protein SEA_FLATHEAD_106 [Mycobacterium phage Flathead]
MPRTILGPHMTYTIGIVAHTSPPQTKPQPNATSSASNGTYRQQHPNKSGH